MPILDKVTTCVQPSAPAPYPHLQLSFLMRASVCVKTSRIVKNVRLPKVQNIQPCRALARSASLSLFSVKSSSLLSILFTVGCLVHRSIQNNFTLFQSAILFLFLPYNSNFFLFKVLKLITAIYIYYIC